VNFHRENAEHGHRIDLYPGLSLPIRSNWAYIEPKAAVRYTAYSLSERPAGQPSSPDRLLPVLSLDSGLFYDRPTSWLGESVTQTLEPRLFYLYVPKSGQDDLPVFDTGEFDFNFDNLFRDNRFNGSDRHGDANQLTLALTSRALADSDGRELVSASLGQIYHFNDRRVTLPNQPTQTDSTSALVTELEARFSNQLRGRAGLQWDPNDGAGDITQALAQLSYRDSDRRLLTLAYRLRKDVAQQVDLAGVWPISDQFSVIGRWNHSLLEDRLLEGLLGIEYGHCCWRVRLMARRYSDSDIDQYNTSILLQLELNGLGKIGDSIDSVLKRGIYGYQINAND
jgi:LPS-assembly protein